MKLRYKIDADSLRKMIPKLTGDKQRIALLRLEFQQISTQISNFIAKMKDEAIYPHILPTQASGRWSTLNPPLTNFPRRCVNPICPLYIHEKTPQCWSLRDCIKPYDDEFWVDFDYDAIENRLFDLILNNKEGLDAFNHGFDPHTPMACHLFHLRLPDNKVDPHISKEDTLWRKEYNWQGKDDKRRVLAKNFKYGSQYTYVKIENNGLKFNPNYILGVTGIEEVVTEFIEGQNIKDFLVSMARRYMTLTQNIQRKKAIIQEKIRRDKIARSLFGSRRVFFVSDEATAKEGFNHIIQGTVVDIMNDVLIKINNEFKDNFSLVHNAHDGAKLAFSKRLDKDETLRKVKDIIEREIWYEDTSVMLTAGFKVIE